MVKKLKHSVEETLTEIKNKKFLSRIDLIKLNEAYQKVLLWFFSYPTKEVSLNDLSSTTKISKTTANRVVAQLSGEGFLKKEVLGRIWRVSCNQSHIYNFSIKISYNLRIIYESGIIEKIHEIVENPRAIILFGSYRRGDDTEKSDIDIAVGVLGDEELRIRQLGIIPKLGYRNNVTVNLHIFSRNKIDLNLFSNIANGIVLEGFLEARP